MNLHLVNFVIKYFVDSKDTFKLNIIVRASDISRKKAQNFAGFSGANSRKNRPISRDFRGKKSKFAEKSANFAGEKSKFAGKSTDFAAF